MAGFGVVRESSVFSQLGPKTKYKKTNDEEGVGAPGGLQAVQLLEG